MLECDFTDLRNLCEALRLAMRDVAETPTDNPLSTELRMALDGITDALWYALDRTQVRVELASSVLRG